jgi:mRNA-degrading endonuclease toxin of MazEF toxin-antitoxin module
VIFRRWTSSRCPSHSSRCRGKRRPALVVSTDALHRAHGTCVAAMITTARHLGDVHLDDIEITNLAKAGLPRPCVIRLARLATFEWSDQIRPIGAFATCQRQTVTALLKRWLDS